MDNTNVTATEDGAQVPGEDENVSVLSSGHRLSILKPPKIREPLQDLNLIQCDDEDETSSTITRGRRVSFAGVNKIKEFNARAESHLVRQAPVYEENFSSSVDSSHQSSSEGCISVDHDDSLLKTNIFLNTTREVHTSFGRTDVCSNDEVYCRKSFCNNVNCEHQSISTEKTENRMLDCDSGYELTADVLNNIRNNCLSYSRETCGVNSSINTNRSSLDQQQEKSLRALRFSEQMEMTETVSCGLLNDQHKEKSHKRFSDQMDMTETISCCRQNDYQLEKSQRSIWISNQMDMTETVSGGCLSHMSVTGTQCVEYNGNTVLDTAGTLNQSKSQPTLNAKSECNNSPELSFSDSMEMTEAVTEGDFGHSHVQCHDFSKTGSNSCINDDSMEYTEAVVVRSINQHCFSNVSSDISDTAFQESMEMTEAISVADISHQTSAEKGIEVQSLTGNEFSNALDTEALNSETGNYKLMDKSVKKQWHTHHLCSSGMEITEALNADISNHTSLDMSIKRPSQSHSHNFSGMEMPHALNTDVGNNASMDDSIQRQSPVFNQGISDMDMTEALRADIGNHKSLDDSIKKHFHTQHQSLSGKEITEVLSDIIGNHTSMNKSSQRQSQTHHQSLSSMEMTKALVDNIVNCTTNKSSQRQSQTNHQSLSSMEMTEALIDKVGKLTTKNESSQRQSHPHHQSLSGTELTESRSDNIGHHTLTNKSSQRRTHQELSDMDMSEAVSGKIGNHTSTNKSSQRQSHTNYQSLSGIEMTEMLSDNMDHHTSVNKSSRRQSCIHQEISDMDMTEAVSDKMSNHALTNKSSQRQSHTNHQSLSGMEITEALSDNMSHHTSTNKSSRRQSCIHQEISDMDMTEAVSDKMSNHALTNNSSQRQPHSNHHSLSGMEMTEAPSDKIGNLTSVNKSIQNQSHSLEIADGLSAGISSHATTGKSIQTQSYATHQNLNRMAMTEVPSVYINNEISMTRNVHQPSHNTGDIELAETLNDDIRNLAQMGENCQHLHTNLECLSEEDQMYIEKGIQRQSDQSLLGIEMRETISEGTSNKISVKKCLVTHSYKKRQSLTGMDISEACIGSDSVQLSMNNGIQLHTKDCNDSSNGTGMSGAIKADRHKRLSVGQRVQSQSWIDNQSLNDTDTTGTHIVDNVTNGTPMQNPSQISGHFGHRSMSDIVSVSLEADINNPSHPTTKTADSFTANSANIYLQNKIILTDNVSESQHEFNNQSVNSDHCETLKDRTLHEPLSNKEHFCSSALLVLDNSISLRNNTGVCAIQHRSEIANVDATLKLNFENRVDTGGQNDLSNISLSSDVVDSRLRNWCSRRKSVNENRPSKFLKFSSENPGPVTSLGGDASDVIHSYFCSSDGMSSSVAPERFTASDDQALSEIETIPVTVKASKSPFKEQTKYRTNRASSQEYCASFVAQLNNDCTRDSIKFLLRQNQYSLLTSLAGDWRLIQCQLSELCTSYTGFSLLFLNGSLELTIVFDNPSESSCHSKERSFSLSVRHHKLESLSPLLKMAVHIVDKKINPNLLKIYKNSDQLCKLIGKICGYCEFAKRFVDRLALLQICYPVCLNDNILKIEMVSMLNMAWFTVSINLDTPDMISSSNVTVDSTMGNVTTRDVQNIFENMKTSGPDAILEFVNNVDNFINSTKVALY